ncbi:unnamed protein product [Enterobius vermicularis]|uniref:Glucosamine 6-phosphate N-acetyltransferase n=1 Tax=Enterobius vermicularis TaxID=51028 RepID=A0A0N4V6A6_ENTVE|nr:unnamed protein product [Enterobius vermicularis]
MMESKLGDADSVIVTGSNLKNQAEKAAQKNPDQLDAYLFDITLLLAIQNEDGIPQLPAGYRARPLHSKDIDMNYFALLEQEEDSFHLDKKAFTEKWGIIIATVTLVIELKYIHALGTRGRVESLIVDSNHRGFGLERVLGTYAFKLARLLSVYKVTVGCSDNLIALFENCGFRKDIGNNVMSQHLDSFCKEEELAKCFRSEGVELFNASILQELDLSKMPELRQNLKVRPLRVDDWGRGYLNVLEQLTVVGAVLETDYRERFKSMQSSTLSRYFVVVIEDLDLKRLVASGTLYIDLHGNEAHGHFEDIVVSENYRGRKLGQYLCTCLLELARRVGIRRLTLEARDRVLEFYKKYGYRRVANLMSYKFCE